MMAIAMKLVVETMVSIIWEIGHAFTDFYGFYEGGRVGCQRIHHCTWCSHSKPNL